MEITKKQIFSFIFLLSIIFPIALLTISVSPAKADNSLTEGQVGFTEIRQVFGGDKAEGDVRSILVNVILIALGFLGSIFLVLVVIGGFKYMTAGGNSDKTVEAVKLLRNAMIGLVIILAAWIITRYTIVMTNRAVKNADTTIYPKTGL